MSRKLARCAFLSAATAAPLAAVHDVKASEQPAASAREVRLEHLRPTQIDAAMKACPTLFLPLGTIEWHGLHNVVGLDALKAHMLAVRAAQRGGGLVAPPLYGGVGGLNQPHTFVIEPEDDVFSNLLRPWLERLCREAVRQGFRSLVILTGHYGAAQQIVIREAAVRMMRVLGVPVLGTPEYFLALDVKYFGDHAAWGETSLMLYLDPPSVDLSQLGNEPHQGVGGRDPKKFATRADGEKLAETIVARLAELARGMPSWDTATRTQFADAEAALVRRQITMAGSGKLWAAWQKIGQGVFNDYGRLLVERRFDEIAKLVEQL